MMAHNGLIKSSVISALVLLLSYPTTSLAQNVFQYCDYTYNISPGKSFLESPYYPNSYPANTACRYKFIAPLDYQIEVTCNISLFSSGNQCTTENFYLDREGDIQLRSTENFCGIGTFVRRSLFRSVVLAYISKGNYGAFRCELNVAPQPCDCGWSINQRIANGVETRINEYPSMVALKDITSAAASFCGGSIVSHRHILTAAHCTRLQPVASNIKVLIGDHDINSNTETKYASSYSIQQIIEHEYYQSSPSPINDIAILITTTPIEWSRGVGPICLPPSTSGSFTYEPVDVVGWGTTSFAGPTSSTLQKISLTVMTNEVCQNEYTSVGANITPGQICTYDSSGQNRDSCQYDSGGPVIKRLSRQFLIGLISFGKACGQGVYPVSVNTRITYYLNWIYSKIGSASCYKAMQ